MAAASAIVNILSAPAAIGMLSGWKIPRPVPTPTTTIPSRANSSATASTLIDKSTRFSLISAASYGAFQIPNNPAQVPLGDFGPANSNSLSLNENEFDTYVANIAALQKKGTDGDAQIAMFSRYAKVNFVPDVYGDLVFNDVASNVTRESLLNGTQFDMSYVVDARHTLRTGFAVTEEQTNVDNNSTVLPVNPVSGDISPTPFTIDDPNSKLGWNIGTYIQDEWKITRELTLNAGLRFDQLYQYVNANQLSPRVALVYKPFADITFHAGYARYFTPPYQAQATHRISRCSPTPPISRRFRSTIRCCRSVRTTTTSASTRRCCRVSRWGSMAITRTRAT